MLGKVLINKSLRMKIIIYNLKGNGKNKGDRKREGVCLHAMKKLQQFNTPHKFFFLEFFWCFYV